MRRRCFPDLPDRRRDVGVRDGRLRRTEAVGKACGGGPRPDAVSLGFGCCSRTFITLILVPTSHKIPGRVPARLR